MSNYLFQILKQYLVAGDTWSWTEDLTDYGYSPTAYTYRLVFSKAGSQPKEFNSNSTGTFSIPSAETNKLIGGDFTVFFQAVTDTTLNTLQEIKIAVAKNPKVNEDPRTYNERIYEALKATLEGVAKYEHSEIVMPSGKQIKNLTIEELVRYETIFAFRVQNERTSSKKKKISSIKLFTR